MQRDPSVQTVLQVTSGMNCGGIESMIMELYRNIDTTKIQFDFVVSINEEMFFSEEIRRLGGRIFYVPPVSETGPLTYVKNLKELIINNGPYTAVHAHTLYNVGLAMIAAKLAKVKIRISHSHNTNAVDKNGFVFKMYFYLMRHLAIKNSTHLLGCGIEACKYLFGKDCVNKGKTIVQPNAINLNKFSRLNNENKLALKELLGLSEDTVVLGHIGRFNKQKNHGFLIEILEKALQEKLKVCLVMIGEGDFKRNIESLVETKGLSEYSHFLGLRNDVPELINIFDIFLFPSLFEGLPVSLVEVQAMGVPCLISDNITDEVDMGVGLIKYLPLGSVDRWVKEIKCTDYKRVPSNVSHKAISQKKYDVKSAVENLLEIYCVK